MRSMSASEGYEAPYLKSVSAVQTQCNHQVTLPPLCYREVYGWRDVLDDYHPVSLRTLDKTFFSQRVLVFFLFLYGNTIYGKCPEISYTNVSGKIACANSADLDQTAPEGKV